MRLQTYEMRSTLEAHRPGGHEELLEIAEQLGKSRVHDCKNDASREDLSGGPIALPFIVVGPRELHEAAPWVEAIYLGPFLKAARAFGGVDVVPSQDVDAYPLINIHPVGHRYETHVDTNPVTALYFLGKRNRTPRTGGALIISRRGDVPNLPSLLEDCDRYYPAIGKLAVMNGYNITHSVEPSNDVPRITVVCNFWTPETPESGRGIGLDKYQSGE